MAIFIGQRPETAFTRVPNEWARDPKLSTRAKGLLLYLLSHQDGYQLSLKQVIAENADGRDAIYKTLGDLVERGYLRREQRRRSGGTVGEVDYFVADAPAQTASGFAVSGGPGSGADQAKQEGPPAQTASWTTGYGAAVSGGSAAKKTRVKKTIPPEDEKTTSPNPSTPGSALTVVDAELLEEGEVSTSSLNFNAETLIEQIRAIRPSWSATDLRTHLAGARAMLDDNAEAVTTVALATARDPDSAKPSRITAGGNPHLRQAKTALMVMRADQAPPTPNSHPNAHPFEAQTNSRTDCQHCPFPEANGRHRVSNQGGGYIAQRHSNYIRMFHANRD